VENFRKISVVIPVYNEEDNVRPLYDKLKKVLESLETEYEIIFVNDGSTDKTQERLEEICRNDKRVKVIEFLKNFGQTPAMVAGIDHADGDVIITMDGDLQNDPEDIPNLLEKLSEGYDVVSGWRKERKDSITRVIPSKIANWLIGKITGVKIHDYGCTLKAYRSFALKNVNLYGELHRFIPAILSTIIPPTKIAEIPVKHHPRIYGKSKYGFSRTLKVLVDLVLVWFLKKFMQKPIHLFGITGMIFLFIGVIPFVYLLCLKLAGHSIGGRPLLIISVFFILFGLQMITTGIISEILLRIYYESQNKRPYVIRRTINVEKN